jgi:hypothetical protein
MAARVSEARARLADRGGRPRVARPADRLLLDGVRTLVTIVLLVLAPGGLAGLGASVGATGLPVGGPVPGLP